MSDSSQSADQFLTPEECAQVDQALLTSSDKFATRVAIYSLRSLKQIAQETDMAIAQLAPAQITEWVANDPSLIPERGFDQNFRQFFSRIVLSSLNPLQRVAEANQSAIEDLSVAQVIAWFEQQAKIRLEQGGRA